MKSFIIEGDGISNTIQKAWISVNKPENFMVKILFEGNSTGWYWNRVPCKIAFSYEINEKEDSKKKGNNEPNKEFFNKNNYNPDDRAKKTYNNSENGTGYQGKKNYPPKQQYYSDLKTSPQRVSRPQYDNGFDKQRPYNNDNGGNWNDNNGGERQNNNGYQKNARYDNDRYGNNNERNNGYRDRNFNDRNDNNRNSSEQRERRYNDRNLSKPNNIYSDNNNNNAASDNNVYQNNFKADVFKKESLPNNNYQETPQFNNNDVAPKKQPMREHPPRESFQKEQQPAAVQNINVRKNEFTQSQEKVNYVKEQSAPSVQPSPAVITKVVEPKVEEVIDHAEMNAWLNDNKNVVLSLFSTIAKTFSICEKYEAFDIKNNVLTIHINFHSIDGIVANHIFASIVILMYKLLRKQYPSVDVKKYKIMIENKLKDNNA